MAINNTNNLNDFRLAFNALESDFTNLSLTSFSSVTLPDNGKVNLGNDSDLQIYHNGTNSIVRDIGPGELLLASDSKISLKKWSGASIENMLVGNADGSVEIYYNNSKKLETTSTGVTLSGNLTVSAITASGNVNADNMTLLGQITVPTVSAGSITTTSNITAGGNLSAEGLTLTQNASVGGSVSVTGDVTAANFNSTSDERVKENIITVENALEKALQLRGVYYNKIGEEKQEIGVIAQEIEKILPEVVVNHNSGIKTVSYGNIVGLLIEAIKDLKKEVDALK